LVAKRQEILRELVPTAARVAVLVNPSNAPVMQSTLSELMVAARAINLQIEFFKASTRQEIDVIFASFVRERPDALFVSTDTFFSSRRAQLVNLASRHGIPTGFPNREAAEIGGLMSYGSNIPNVWRQAGAYAGRILEGAKPVDLPVVQSSNFELVINAIGRLHRHASQKIATCAMRWMTLAAKKKARWSCAPPGIARPSIDLRGVQAQSPNIHSHKQPMVNGIMAPIYTSRPNSPTSVAAMPPDTASNSVLVSSRISLVSSAFMGSLRCFQVKADLSSVRRGVLWRTTLSERCDRSHNNVDFS
jgi:hypothetical protein